MFSRTTVSLDGSEGFKGHQNVGLTSVLAWRCQEGALEVFGGGG